jgi:Uncharacterized conserved protein
VLDQQGEQPKVVVVGGGIAGLAAACGLAEHGVTVDVIEAEASLGGRLRAWPIALPGGTVTMSRGFHAFFRQYYNLRALLRRADPTLARLAPVADYPLELAPSGASGPVRDSFAKIPRTPPWNLVGFVAQSPSFGLADLAKVDVGRALDLLRVGFPQTYTELDGVSAAEFLDRLKFPAQARHLALEVFARSFFADPAEFSAGELVAMFHTYFVGSAEGLLFDVPDDDYDTALWQPLREYLERRQVRFTTGTRAHAVTDGASGPVVVTDAGERAADAVVLALDTRGLQALVASSPTLGDAAWRERVAALRTSPPFGVGRRWLAGRVDGIEPFLGTSGYGPLDNLSRVDALEAGAAGWATRTGGTVVEVHGYALTDPSTQTRDELWRQAARLHPGLAAAPVRAEQWLVREDCPLVGTTPWRDRPTVATPDPRVVLAGDLVRSDWPIALMERAATTGWQAANALLAGFGRPGHELWSPPLRGLLAGARR